MPGALSAAPGNDQFANAQVLSGETGTVSGTNVEATKELGEPNHAGDPGGASVWFTWTAPRSGVLVVDTCDSDFDTLLAVYTGSAVNTLAKVAANDDACDLQSGLEDDVIGGTEYRIAVDGAGGVQGPITLVYGLSPVNDDFADAQVLVGEEGIVEGSNVYAGHELSEPFHAGAEGAGSVWYRWMAPRNLIVEFSACDAEFDSVLGVYRGSELATLQHVASDDDACAPGARIEFSAEAGVEYRIAVDGFEPGQVGHFALRWRVPPPPSATVAPSITGVPLDGERLTGHLGEWTGAPPIGYEWWWEQCDALSNCWRLTVEREQTIQARAGLLRFAVRAQTRHGATTAYSAIVRVAWRPPRITSPPRISSRPPRVGMEVTLDTFGEWTGTQPTRVHFRWQRCRPDERACVLSFEGDENEAYAYTPVAADIGFVLRVAITVTNEGGEASATAVPTAPVVAASRPFCRVPRLVGKTLKTARRSLAKAKCRLGTVRRSWSARRRGVILAQRPRAGTRLRVRGRVNVVLSKGRRR